MKGQGKPRGVDVRECGKTLPMAAASHCECGVQVFRVAHEQWKREDDSSFNCITQLVHKSKTGALKSKYMYEYIPTEISCLRPRCNVAILIECSAETGFQLLLNFLLPGSYVSGSITSEENLMLICFLLPSLLPDWRSDHCHETDLVFSCFPTVCQSGGLNPEINVVFFVSFLRSAPCVTGNINSEANLMFICCLLFPP